MMPGLTIGWEYLTGYAVATDPASRDRAEWPPHPGRVFMALAAAHFETGNDPAEAGALQLVEQLGEPLLFLPPEEQVHERSNVTVYVPVNDKAGPAAATMQSVPAVTRSKQPRTYPRRWVGSQHCHMHWPDAELMPSQLVTLDALCAKVTRIGHSSSLVRMWATSEAPTEGARWEPGSINATSHCRTISPGLLHALPEQTNIPRIEAFAALATTIEDAEHRVAVAKADKDAPAQRSHSKDLKQAKADYEATFNEPWKKAASPPPLLRPRLGLWTGYLQAKQADSNFNATTSHFDTDVIILSRATGQVLPLVTTLGMTTNLRKLLISTCSQPVPEWVTGHKANGERSESDSGHLALIPLPDVSHEHADGHLLGVGLVFPSNVPREERGRVLGPALLEATGQPRTLTVYMGHVGTWTIGKSDWSEARQSLKPDTWTAHPNGRLTWASVTPVVLDRYPRMDRNKDRDSWTREVAGIIADACERIGLPRPADVDVDTTCWHLGSPRAVGKRRPLRSLRSPDQRDAPLGDGFPMYPAKGTKAPRPQVHVRLQFNQHVVGPVLLGAGRYMGYGLCKPIGGAR
jgi:CRISPR-associated protein Csb2